MGKTWLVGAVVVAVAWAGSVRAGGLDPGAMMPVPKPKGPPPTAPQPHKGKLYRHRVIGFSFWHPSDWTVKEHDDGLQLIPSKAAATAQGPSEVYFITGESVAGEGIQHAGDPRVVQYVDAAVRSLSPTMARTGQAVPVPMTGGQGVLLQWQGRGGSGQAVQARAYVAIIRHHGVSLIALGLPDCLTARDPDLRRIFASFAFGQGQRDAQLVGTWHLLATTSITNWSTWETHWSRAQAVSDHNSFLEFRADGTWTRTDKYHTIVGAGGLWREMKDSEVHTGRWNAGSGQLYMVWKDNSWDDHKYQVVRASDGLQLRLATGSKGQLWKRVR